MPAIPAAEVKVNADLVRSLLHDQHPDLADLPLRIAANGWDNVMFRLGDDLAVRMPRRLLGAGLMDKELQWLPALASRLPGAIPAPVRRGLPGHGYPWSWAVVPWFDGQPLTQIAPEHRRPLAIPFAEFFAALHVPAPANAPANPVRAVPLATRDPHVRQRIAGRPDAALLTALWEWALAAPRWDDPPLWVHGDPHPANVVVHVAEPDGEGRGPAIALAAVVDFGDLTAGDPASDLATAWLTFTAADRAVFRDRYDDLTGRDAATWERAKGWALHLSLIFLTECDDAPALRAIGEHGLAQLTGT